MKRILSLILASSIVCSIMPNVLAAGSIVTAYENFEYAENTKLNACTDLQSQLKGFTGDWSGSAQLSSAVTDNFSVAGNGKIKSTVSASNTIYRQLSNVLDFTTDGMYTISWDMQMNTGAAVSDNTRTQKLALTNLGVTKSTDQLQFGYACGRDGGVSLYMRTLSSINFFDDTRIELGKLYHNFVIINTNSSKEDEITYLLYPDGAEEEAAIQKKNVSVDKNFDVVLYQEYTGGTGNEFGNLSIEYYDADTAVKVKNAQSLIQIAKESLSDTDVQSANEAVADISQGKMKEYFAGQLEDINEAIQSDKNLVDDIEREITAIKNGILSFTDKDEVRQRLNVLEQNIAEVVNADRKGILISEMVNLCNLFDAVILVETAEDTEGIDDIENARIKVNALAASTEKDSLLERLDTLQKSVALQAAYEKTAAAEMLKTLSSLKAARVWVDTLDAGSEKEQLNNRLNAVETYINLFIPEIKEFTVSGLATVGGVLEAQYEIQDLCENLKEIEIKWYYADSENGLWQTINVSGNALDIIQIYSGKYIKAVVRAVNTNGLKGEEKSSTVYISPSAKIAYEPFDYTVGQKLNTIPSALSADDTKGFYSGWRSDVNLSADVADDFVVAEGGMLENLPSNKSIYRGMNNSISLSNDGIYILSWDMKPNSGSAVLENTRTQKFSLVTKGSASNQTQIQFGFVGGANGMSPYMRTLSDTKTNTNTIISAGTVYHMLAYIESAANGNDKVNYMVYDDNEQLKTEWNISYEQDINNDFDLIGYTGYTGGTAKNAVGNIVLEYYDKPLKSVIKEIEADISKAETEFSEEKLVELSNRAESLPDGKAKELILAKIQNANERIIQEKEKTEEVSLELNKLKSETVNASNADTIKAGLESIYGKIDSISIAAEKERLMEEYEAVEKALQTQMILATRTIDVFDYTDSSQASLSDLPNGWSDGYADEEGNAITNLVFQNGKIIFGDETRIYRNMTYPATADEKYDTYIKLKFTLSENGNAFLNLGDLKFDFAKNTSVTYNGKTVLSDSEIERGKEYTAIIKIGMSEAKIAVFASDDFYWGDNEITVNIEGFYAYTVGMGGCNAAIHEFVKENTGKAYTNGANESIKNLLDYMTEENLNIAAQESGSLIPSIIKNLSEKIIDGVTEKRKTTLPVIRNVGISGTGKVGKVLLANCSIDDAVKNLKVINYAWYCGGQLISTESSFVPNSNHSGKKVYCSVTVTNNDGKTSEPVNSNTVNIVDSTTSYSGGGSSGGGSSAGNLPKPIPNPIYFETETGFTDVGGHWAEETIKDMVEIGVASGISDQEFKPDAAVNRAEFVAFLTRALKLNDTNKTIEFSDVASNDWFYSSVLSASDFVSGWDGQFHPYDNITREAMARIIFLAGKDKIEQHQEVESNFADKDEMSEWSADYIGKVCGAGLFIGDDNNCFAPKKSATRAEALTVIAKLLDILNSED